MKTYWLYYWHRLIASIRLPEGATLAQVRNAALRRHDIMPCAGALYPDYAPFEIRNMIANSQLEP